MDMYYGCYIQNMDIYIMDFGNLGTNVANGSDRILTYQICVRQFVRHTNVAHIVFVNLFQLLGNMHQVRKCWVLGVLTRGP